MSKYSHFEMCEKIFGQKYKWNEQKHDYEPYSRTDMWNKMIEQQDKIADLEAKLAESEKERHEEWKTGKEWKWEWQKVNQKLEKADQDKISFALEQLEKVKAELVKLEQDYSLSWCGIKIYNFIDDKIKELKGEK